MKKLTPIKRSVSLAMLLFTLLMVVGMLGSTVFADDRNDLHQADKVTYVGKLTTLQFTAAKSPAALFDREIAKLPDDFSLTDTMLTNQRRSIFRREIRQKL